MAWRSLLTASGKRYKGCFLNGFRNTIERSAVPIPGSYVGNPEVCGSKLSEVNQGLLNSHSVTSKSAPLSAPLLQDRVNPINLSDIITQRNIQIENGEVLYSRMSTKELLSTLFNLYLVSYEPLVDLSIKMLESQLFQHPVLRIPLLQAVKQTAYSHFCAGENPAEASATLQRMRELGLKGIPYNSLEDAMDNASCDQNLDKFLNTLHTTLRLSPGSVVCEEARRRGIQMGVKLVRGAYIVKETALAASLGAPSPIHSSIEETHRSYDACARIMMDKAAMAQASLILATHNFHSGKAAAAKAEELNIRKGNDRIQFAQLKGMADSLSLGLAQAGFQVSKYIPFGPVDEVMPYLIRRAQENRGLLSTTRADRQRIR